MAGDGENRRSEKGDRDELALTDRAVPGKFRRVGDYANGEGGRNKLADECERRGDAGIDEHVTERGIGRGPECGLRGLDGAQPFDDP